MSEISTFKVHNDKFNSILGQFPTITLLSQNDAYPFAHEAGVYIKATKELFITSNRYTDPITKASRIQITRVDLSKDPVTCEEIDPKIPMGNGGVNYTNDAEILICSQGTKIEPSGLYTMSTTAPYSAKLLVADFLGRPFNSVNDVVVHSDGSIWFTDPIYGFEQGYRPEPQLPCQIYRYDPSDGSIRAIADGFGRPNGICFSPDERTVYITDTDRHHGDGSDVPFRVSSIYAFDLSVYHGQPFLTNRRLFAMTDNGIPDGIKCDMEGNVYSGCGDGIHVWSPGGVLLGRIRIDGGCANFCFGEGGEIFALNEHRLWRVQLGGHVKGALLGI